jgi:two-component system, chemotaxis family, protein-glutamate methylesterase/glutaminase
MSALSAEDPSVRDIELVVIGGSAGAVEVLQAVMRGLRSTLRPAVVVVLHMPPNAKGVLHEILARPAGPPMKIAEDKEPIVPGTVYFAAPGYHLLVEGGGTFALSLDDPVHFSRPSIDVLFETAADAYGARVMGIILSGANSDGAAGLMSVAETGGVAIVQDPATADVSVMPEAALKSCATCRQLGVPAIGELLASL